jgi:hypothetical protein
MLQRHPESKVRVLVVWEPVQWNDRRGPSRNTYAHISDTRAAQYWDPDRSLSRQIVGDVMRNRGLLPEGEHMNVNAIVWDAAAVFPPGVRWEDAFPKPAYAGWPVVNVIREVEKAATAG